MCIIICAKSKVCVTKQTFAEIFQASFGQAPLCTLADYLFFTSENFIIRFFISSKDNHIWISIQIEKLVFHHMCMYFKCVCFVFVYYWCLYLYFYSIGISLKAHCISQLYFMQVQANAAKL